MAPAMDLAMNGTEWDEDPLDQPLPPRGWSMRRGHLKALETRCDCRCLSSPNGASLGRSAVKRSVNRSSRRFETEERKSSKLRRFRRRQLREEVLEASWEESMISHEAIEPQSLFLEGCYKFPSLDSGYQQLQIVKESFKEVDEEVASLSSSTTAGSDTSDISMHLQMQSCRSRWEAAVCLANFVATGYVRVKKTMDEPKKKKEKILSAEQKYLEELREQYSVDISYDLKPRHTCESDKFSAGYESFEKFRSSFFYTHGDQFLGQLQRLYQPGWHLRAAPVGESARKRFLETFEEKKDKLMMVFHGTDSTFLHSIYHNGLLVPGKNNGVRVVNGTAHGRGVYAAKSNFASISWSYSRGEEKPMLVCAALDGPSEEVKRLPNFFVFYHSHYVLPLFEASLKRLPCRPPKPSKPLKSSVTKVTPKVDSNKIKKPKKPGPKCRITTISGSTPNVNLFLSRRAACKRRDGWSPVCTVYSRRFLMTSSASVAFYPEDFRQPALFSGWCAVYSFSFQISKCNLHLGANCQERSTKRCQQQQQQQRQQQQPIA